MYIKFKYNIIKSIQKNYIPNNLKDVKRKIYRILIQYFRKRNANF